MTELLSCLISHHVKLSILSPITMLESTRFASIQTEPALLLVVKTGECISGISEARDLSNDTMLTAPMSMASSSIPMVATFFLQAVTQLSRSGIFVKVTSSIRSTVTKEHQVLLASLLAVTTSLPVVQILSSWSGRATSMRTNKNSLKISEPKVRQINQLELLQFHSAYQLARKEPEAHLRPRKELLQLDRN